MLRLRSIVILFVSFLFLYISTGDAAAQDGMNWLVSPELLEHAKLKILWQNQLPIKKSENLEKLFIVSNRIYTLSDQNYMVSLNRVNGNVVFSKSIAPAGFPIMGLSLYRNALISVIGNTLVQLDPDTAAENKIIDMEYRVACPAARNSSFFYVSGSDRRLHTYNADNKVQAFEVSASDESMITSVIADAEFIVFGTEGGSLVSFTPDKPKLLWQFNVSDAIIGPIVHDEMSLYFAIKGTYVYRIDIDYPMSARLGWRCQMPGILDRAPRVTRQVVYQYAISGGMTAINKQNGSSLWSLKQGTDLLAEANGKAYIFTNAGALAVMDNSGGKTLYTVNFANVSRYAANTEDSKIYIADQRGRLACLEPVE
jgi:outer membrane protein assembly factor BamB